MFLSLLENRRSTRKFRPKPLSRDEIEILVEALLRSPSSRGRNPWEFILVTDGEMLDKLARAKEHGSAFLKAAPLAVVVCADPERCDVWVEDCAIASIIVQLTAESMGLGSCWTQIRLRPHGDGTSAEEYLREVLGLPERYAVASIIGIGHPEERLPGHPKESLQFDKIHFDRYRRTAEE
jgi:nitroreductase